ncbi:hypothetical protein A1S_3740 [Acinetobacter baumannii ATCC 17978]|nr:hypothetical protein A1S_3740 [Acinetobacter baumannii ATCC 17978]
MFTHWFHPFHLSLNYLNQTVKMHFPVSEIH